jgi:hypothetical protein
MAKDMTLQRVQYAVRRGLAEEIAACQGLLAWKMRIERAMQMGCHIFWSLGPEILIPVRGAITASPG